MSQQLKLFAIVIAAWQVASAIAFAVLGYAIGAVVYSIYTGLFGDVQDSYATYHRAATYSVMIVVTALATAVGLGLLIGMERRRAIIRHTIATFVTWHTAAVAALVASEEFGLYWLFHRLDWMFFGVPENLYSFCNIMLPRVIAWVVASSTAIALVLWLRNKLAPVQRRPPGRRTGGPAAASPADSALTDENRYAPPQSTQPPS